MNLRRLGIGHLAATLSLAVLLADADVVHAQTFARDVSWTNGSLDASCLTTLANGVTIVGGATETTLIDVDPWVMAIDQAGSTLWSKGFDTPSYGINIRAAAPLNNSEVLVVGSRYGGPGSRASTPPMAAFLLSTTTSASTPATRSSFPRPTAACSAWATTLPPSSGRRPRFC